MTLDKKMMGLIEEYVISLGSQWTYLYDGKGTFIRKEESFNPVDKNLKIIINRAMKFILENPEKFGLQPIEKQTSEDT